jgi:hypothetical protein
MKKMFLLGLIIRLIVVIGGFEVYPDTGNFNISRVSDWGNSGYHSLSVYRNYCYVVSPTGIDIIDITNTAFPQKKASFNPQKEAKLLRINGDHMYLVFKDGEIRILNLSNPLSPVQVWNSNFEDISRMAFAGNILYLATGDGLYILDITTPSSPLILFSPSGNEQMQDIYVAGKYVYGAYGDDGLKIFDVSVPQTPVLVGQYHQTKCFLHSLSVSGNFACLVMRFLDSEIDDFWEKVLWMDVSNPASPQLLGTYTGASKSSSPEGLQIIGNIVFVPFHFFNKGTYKSDGYLSIIDFSDSTEPTSIFHIDGIFWDLERVGNHLFMAADYDGLRIYDISQPGSPVLSGEYDASGEGFDVCFNGNYAYLVGNSYGLQVLDISNPTNIHRVGHYKENFDNLFDIAIEGNLVYLAQGWVSGGFRIIDVTNPAEPKSLDPVWQEMCGDIPCVYYAVAVSNNYAFLPNRYTKKLDVWDLSMPSKPALISRFEIGSDVFDLDIKNNYAYLASSNGLLILDITTPSAPVLVSKNEHLGSLGAIKIVGNNAFCITNNLWDSNAGFIVVDISNHYQLRQVGIYASAKAGGTLDVRGDFAYLSNSNQGVKVLDVSDFSSIKIVGRYSGNGYCRAVRYHNGYLYAVNLDDGKLTALYFNENGTQNQPSINLNKHSMNFYYRQSGQWSGPQSFVISCMGGAPSWTISTSANWLNVSPSSGEGGAEIEVSIDIDNIQTSKLEVKGSITVSSNEAVDSPMSIFVKCTKLQSSQGIPPFGSFDTPVDGSIVSGSIPVTGWALDDLGIECVQIFREDKGSILFIGDAVFIKGARPDIEQAYPGYPNNHKAGWGYMMLTNFLPNGGNGTFNIHAIATDLEGNQVTLGTKTIICDNANAVKPFGAIDTPAQGGTASGSDYINFGWTLTPLPNTIPVDGSTIQVWVDGLFLGNPIYNQYREDIATLFPNYNNSNGAVGYFYLDTTKYENGVHTIAWSAEDDAGNADGIGSRYFTIQNLAECTAKSAERSDNLARFHDFSKIPIDYSEPIGVIKGFNRNGIPLKSYPDGNGNITIEIRELERIEVRLFPVGTGGLAHLLSSTGFQVIGGQLRPLPIGSTLDRKNGVFCWQPGPGFIGEYRLVFIRKEQNDEMSRIDLNVRINPIFVKPGTGE